METQAQAATSTPREDQATARRMSRDTARLPHTEAHTRFHPNQARVCKLRPSGQIQTHLFLHTFHPQAFQLPPSWAAAAPLTAKPKQRPRGPFTEKVGRALMRTGAPRGSDRRPTLMSDSRPLLPPLALRGRTGQVCVRQALWRTLPPEAAAPTPAARSLRPGQGKASCFAPGEEALLLRLSPWKSPNSYFKLTTKENEF